MNKRLIAWILSAVLGLAWSGSALAFFHLWRINEIFSNADGSVQFIEVICSTSFGCHDGEIFSSGVNITVTPAGGSPGTPFTFIGNQTAPIVNKTLLLATPGFAAAAGVTPNYTIPAGFIAVNGGSINFGGFDVVNYSALPTNGQSVNRNGVAAANTPTNFAGVTGSVPAGDTTAPTVPGNFSATAVSSSQINLGWTASTDAVGVTAYHVFRNGVQIQTLGSGTLAFNDTGLTPSTLYNYGVRACDAAGNCSAQAATSATTQAAPDTTAPTVPGSFAATAISNSQIVLGWAASTDAGGVTAYHVFRGGVQIATLNSATLAYSDTGRTTSTLYNYGVRACDAAGNCSTQAAAAATTLAWPGLVFGPGARTQFEGFRDGPAADTYIDFNSTPVGALTTQLSGLTFQSNIDAAGNPFGPIGVRVSTAPQCTVRCIVGTPDESGDDGRVGYQILFATPQRRAGLLRNWLAQYSVTRFYNASGVLLAEHINTVNAQFVGFIAVGSNPATDWVARIQIDGLMNDGVNRQVGYSDDLFYGSAAPGPTFAPALDPGFNLISNSLDITLNVATTFGNADVPVADVTGNVVSLWKWNAATARWAFYAPQQSAAGIAAFAASKGYDVLTTINPGEGYWVNALTPVTLPAQAGSPFNWTPGTFVNLPSGFNLIAHTDERTPSEFNIDVSPTPPAPGTVPTTNFLTLWVWDAAAAKWYFYSTLLESSGGLPAVKSFADSHLYLHFQDSNKKIGLGVGFWVNRP